MICITKPCRKCGAIDRNPKIGYCRACQRACYKSRTPEQIETSRIYNREYLRKVREKNPNYGKEWVKANTHKMPVYHRKHRYGMTEKDYQDLLEKQNDKCAICKVNKNRLCVDHCHISNKIRGLLCVNCNIHVGYYERLNTQPELQESMTLYLKGINND